LAARVAARLETEEERTKREIEEKDREFAQQILAAEKAKIRVKKELKQVIRELLIRTTFFPSK